MSNPRTFIETRPEDQQYAIQCVNPTMRSGQLDAAHDFGVASNLPLRGGRGPLHGGGGGNGNGEGGDEQIFEIAHRALRGKYWLVILLGLAFGFAGAKVGLKLGKPVYRSEGLIRIAYRSPPVLKQADDNLPIEVFDAFLQSQKLLIASRRLTEQAWSDPQLQAMLPSRKKNIEDLGDIKVEQKPGADYLVLSLVDRDPDFAAAAVKAVVKAYESVFRAQSDEFQQQRIARLGVEQATLEKQLAEKQAELKTVAGDEAFVDIEKRRDAAAREMEQYRAMLTDFRIALVMAQNRPMNPAASQPAAAVAAELAAINDPYLRNLMDQRIKCEENIDHLQLLGYSDQFRDMQTAKQQLAKVQEKITKYLAQPRPIATTLQPGSLPVAQTGPLALANRSIEDLRADEAGVKKLYDTANTQMASLAQKAEKSETLRLQIKDLNTDLSEITRRKRLLEMEGGLAAKLSIISYGEVPITPYQDRRLIKAGMGGMAGLFFPAVLFVAIGWLNTRFRYSGETEDAIAKRTPLLGIVPAVPDRIRDPEQAATAAESVHHIRVMLQLQRQNVEGGVYMVTSSSASEGKTSITVALGMSYAASGCKTLIIDCDPVGRALTRGFTAERMSGFREALVNGEMQNFVREQSTGLCVLPVGDADASTGWTVSPATIARLLAKAKREFDVILVDTGPILGSVVASVVAPAVDDVIFVVSRGAQRPRVERAIRYLDSIGAHVAGCVFNRAKVREYERSISKSMSSPSTRRAKLSAARDCHLKGMQGFGPLVECVTAFVPRANGHGD
jgi:Mrp family chromosome partitioning ATPase/uncharacterized protein involved in exopolysaccharide biosynthesis